MSLFEGVRQRHVGSRNRNQMYVVRHEAVTQQRKMVEFGILPQQFDVSGAVGVVVENYLSGIAPLRNMVRNVNDHHARKSGHAMKLSEGMQPRNKISLVSVVSARRFPYWAQETGVRPVCPRISGKLLDEW